MEKLKMHSPDKVQTTLDKLAELLPGCVTVARNQTTGALDRQVDLDRLRQELSGFVVEGPRERYHLDWPGKRAAVAVSNAPLPKALRPQRDQSVDFDRSKNLFIEGDNLEALKLLQESYLGKVKLIYIDPPYNTGSDFLYRDDFAESPERYLELSRQRDEGGSRLVANLESNGRFHSDWLSMLFPRLRLARNLLATHGAIAVQIDDNELSNLIAMMDEVFGPANHVATICVKMSHLSGMKMAHVEHKVPKIKEFIVIYARSRESLKLTPVYEPCSWDEAFDRYTRVVVDPNVPLDAWTFQTVNECTRGLDEKQRDEWCVTNAARIFRTAVNDALKDTPKDGRVREHITATGLRRLVLNREEVIFARSRMKEIEGRFVPVRAMGDIWTDIGINNLHNEGGVAFANGKKPLKLVRRLISMLGTGESNRDPDVVLDFFAGSGTTGEAVLQQSVADGRERRYILVQLPETCAPDSEAAQSGFKTIAEITRKRLALAADELRSQLGVSGVKSSGFRSFAVDSSNMTDVYYSPDQLQQAQLVLAAEHIKSDRTGEDLLFQVFLDWGVDLALPIERRDVLGRTVFLVDGNALVACFETGVDEGLVRELATHRPLRAVFRDGGYASDSTKINVEQIFKLLSPETEVRSL